LFFVFVGGYFGVLYFYGVAWFCGVDLVVPEAEFYFSCAIYDGGVGYSGVVSKSCDDVFWFGYVLDCCLEVYFFHADLEVFDLEGLGLGAFFSVVFVVEVVVSDFFYGVFVFGEEVLWDFELGDHFCVLGY
jgi:hypothetical protein